MKKKSAWIPEIVYPDQGSLVPHIFVPKTEMKPTVLFFMLHQQTNETEVGSNGKETSIFDTIIEQYVPLSIIKETVSPKVLEKIRIACGLPEKKEK